jgi:protein associated with RNAse G/E
MTEPTVQIAYTKWGGDLHWNFVLEALGTDEYGHWYGGRSGMLLNKPGRNPVVQQGDFVMLVPTTGDWTACYNEESDVEIYVDVTDTPTVTEHDVGAVDLDLDVVRRRDGSVELWDEDEFAEHQLRYGYPAEVIATAQASADWLMDAVSRRVGPFDTAGTNWLERFATS